MTQSPPGTEAPISRLMAGVLLKLVSTLSFTVMSALVKLIAAGAKPGASYPIGETVFCRAFFAMIPIFVWLAWQSDLRQAWTTRNPLGHLRRSVIGSFGMFFGFAALSLLPLADATAISYAAPIFTVVLAALVLKEKVRIYRWTAVGVGFLGVLVMLYPHLSTGALAGASDNATRGALLGLAGAICAAFATTETRRLTASETTGAIVFFFMAMVTMAALTTLPLGWIGLMPSWQWPGGRDLALLIAVGVAGGIGQITLTQSFRYADASVIAPLDYVSMLWAVLIGWFLFAELPHPLIALGAVIVIGAGIFVIYRERRLGIDRSRSKATSPTRGL
jgi:drug/metabolite transporter (DMT)-like permease